MNVNTIVMFAIVLIAALFIGGWVYQTVNSQNATVSDMAATIRKYKDAVDSPPNAGANLNEIFNQSAVCDECGIGTYHAHEPETDPLPE